MPNALHRCLSRALMIALLAALAACKPGSTDTPAATTDRTSAPTATTAPAAAAAAATATADTLAPASNPKAEIMASAGRFSSLRSYHATMRMRGGPQGETTSAVDFVAPDRFRMQMPMGTQVIIGDTMYMQVQGRTMKVPMPAGTLTQWRDPANLSKDQAGMTVEALGDESIDGMPARKYLVHHAGPEPVDVTMWIGDAGYPLQIHVEGKGGEAFTSTTRYSRINDPTIRIDPPQ